MSREMTQTRQSLRDHIFIANFHMQTGNRPYFAQACFRLTGHDNEHIIAFCDARDGSYNLLLLFLRQAAPGIHRTFTGPSMTPLSEIRRVLHRAVDCHPVLSGGVASNAEAAAGSTEQALQGELMLQSDMV